MAKVAVLQKQESQLDEEAQTLDCKPQILKHGSQKNTLNIPLDASFWHSMCMCTGILAVSAWMFGDFAQAPQGPAGGWAVRAARPSADGSRRPPLCSCRECLGPGRSLLQIRVVLTSQQSQISMGQQSASECSQQGSYFCIGALSCWKLSRGNLGLSLVGLL